MYGDCTSSIRMLRSLVSPHSRCGLWHAKISRVQCFFDRMLKGRATRRRRDAGGWVPESTTPDLTAGADSPVLADAEAGFDPGKFVSVDSSQNSDDECWRKCGHLLPSPSGDLQASEFRRCWRLCKGALHE